MVLRELVILHKGLVSPYFILFEGWLPQKISYIQPHVGIPATNIIDR